MRKLKTVASKKLKLSPEQVQIFTPTPSTWSAVMYYTGLNPFTMEKLFVERSVGSRGRQKDILTDKTERDKDRQPLEHAQRGPELRHRDQSRKRSKSPRAPGRSAKP